MERVNKLIYILFFILNFILSNFLKASKKNEIKFVEIKILDKVSSINSKLIIRNWK